MPLELFWTFLDVNNHSVPLPELTTINRIGKKIAVLEIPVVTQFHRGTYVCTAKNRADRVSQSAVLSVNGKQLRRTNKMFLACLLYLLTLICWQYGAKSYFFRSKQ